MVGLVRSERRPENLSREFEPTAQSAWNWVRQAGHDGGTLDCEILDRRNFRSQAEARMAVFQFIEGFYTPTRRHSALGYLSPIEYEVRAMAEND